MPVLRVVPPRVKYNAKARTVCPICRISMHAKAMGKHEQSFQHIMGKRAKAAANGSGR